MAIQAQRSSGSRATGLRKGTVPRRARLLAHDPDPRELAWLRSCVSSAFYHAHAREEHQHAPYPFAQLSLEHIRSHFARHPQPWLQQFVAAALLDKPKSEFDPVIEALVGSANADKVREALEQQARIAQLSPSGSWRVGAEPLAKWDRRRSCRKQSAWQGPSRFAFAHETLGKLIGPPPQPLVTFNGALPLRTPRPRQARARRQALMPGLELELPTDLDVFWEYDELTQITNVRAEVTVERPPADFVVIADPQNWQDAAFLFFQCSELVQLVGGEYVPIPNPAPPGSASYLQLLHEIVTISFNPFWPMVGSNVLIVDYDHGAAGHCGMECSLFSSLTTVIGPSLEKGGLDIDGGSFHAIALDAEHTRLISTKQVRFTERELCGLSLGKSLNEFAPLWLTPWIALLTYQAGMA